MYISYLAHTQKIEEIITLNTLMKPIFNWGRLASEIVMATRGWSNRDLVTRGNHSPGSTNSRLLSAPQYIYIYIYIRNQETFIFQKQQT